MNEHSYFNRILLLKTIFLFEVFLGVTNHSCFAFTIATKLVSPTARTNAAITFSPSILTLAQAAKNDDDNDIPPPPSNKRPSLGIDIGAQLTPLTPEQAAELKSEASEKINEAFDGRLDEIENMRTQIAQDFETSKQKLRKDSDERAQVATTKLMSKIDQLSNDFLMENEELRMGTKLSAKADRNNMNEGNGLEVGSWGSVGGMNVGMSMGLKGGSSGLLGSVASVASGLSSVVEEEEDDTSDSRIMVICDDKQVRCVLYRIMESGVYTFIISQTRFPNLHFLLFPPFRIKMYKRFLIDLKRYSRINLQILSPLNISNQQLLSPWEEMMRNASSFHLHLFPMDNHPPIIY
jgi:hypothetical protein